MQPSLHPGYNSTHPVHVRSAAQSNSHVPVFLLQAISAVITERYFAVALSAVLLYDFFIIIEREAKFFWVPGLIYFLIRCVGLVGTIANIGTGFGATLITPILALGFVALHLTIKSVEYILIIRVLALYHNNIRLGILLKSLFAFTTIAGLGLLIYCTSSAGAKVARFPNGITTCVYGRNTTHQMMAVLIIPMVQEMVLLTLALYKAYEYLKELAGLKGFHLVQVCIKDQALYYVLVIVFCAVRLGYLFVTDKFAANILNAAGSPTILCILGTRLLINLREAAEKGSNGGVTDRLRTISNMQFA